MRRIQSQIRTRAQSLPALLPCLLLATASIPLAAQATTPGASATATPKEATPLSMQDKASDAQQSAWTASQMAGDAALATGLPSVALNFYREAEKAAGNDYLLLDKTRIAQVSALIHEGSWMEARTVLGRVSAAGKATPAWTLRDQFTALHEHRIPATELHQRLELAGRIAKAVPPSDRIWAKVLQGLLEEAQGNEKERDRLLAEAQSLAASDDQRAQLDILLRRSLMRRGPAVDDTTIAHLRRRMEGKRGTAEGYEAAKLLAIALVRMSQQPEALRVLDEQLLIIQDPYSTTRRELLLLSALIEGPETERGRARLLSSIRLKISDSLARVALHLLANGNRPGRTEVVQDALRKAINEAHPLADEMSYKLAQLYLAEDNPDMANALFDEWERRTSRDASSSTASDAAQLDWHRQMIYIAMHRTPERHRVAAVHYLALRKALPPSEESARMALGEADCLYQVDDKAAALESYKAAWEIAASRPDAALRGVIMRQVVRTYLDLGRIADATAWLDKVPRTQAPDSARWEAEWNLALGLRAAKESQQALQRVERMLASNPADELKLRLLWLRTELVFECGDTAAVAHLADDTLAELARQSGRISPSLREETASRAKLLAAEASLARGGQWVADGQSRLARLRTEHPSGDSTALSYLVEARFHMARNDLNEALKAVRELLDNPAFAKSPYAPIALYEAALFSEQRGLGSTEQGPQKLLEEFDQRFPTHTLAFQARIRLANALRRSGKPEDFAAALTICEKLIDKNPTHPDRPRAEMVKAECQMGLANETGTLIDAAQSTFERIYDNTLLPMDFRIEAGEKYAECCLRKRQRDNATRMLQKLANEYLPTGKSPAPDLGANGRYWLARALLLHADMLQEGRRTQEAIVKLRQVIDAGLPGSRLAASRLEALGVSVK